MVDERKIIVEDAGERIDKFMNERIEGTSRTEISGWLKEGAVYVNGAPVKANYKVRRDDVITWDAPEEPPVNYEAENLPLRIVYEDDDLIVIDKEAGMIVHPAPGVYTGTLVNALLYHWKNQLSTVGGASRPGIVHRLDKDTSGLMVVCKNDAAHRALSEALQHRDVHRHYMVLVHGRFSQDDGTVDFPIGRSPNNTGKMAVRGRAMRSAMTHYTVKERFDKLTLVECQLETGRTHQIRVHMQAIGHPIVGDPLYGVKNEKYTLPYQLLHAFSLAFTHPVTGEELHFTAEPHEPFASFLEMQRKTKKI